MKFQVAGASVQGTGHLKHNIPCQDSYACDVTDECVIVCVADGLGSARLSHIGSARAVQTALKAIQRHFDTRDEDKARRAMIEVFREVNSDLRSLASLNENDIRDYATTLICVLAQADNIIVGHVGDGAVVISQDDTLVLLSAPQRGEYANEVAPVTSENFEDMLQISFRSSGIDYIAVFSDGLERLALDLNASRPFAPFFGPLFAAIAKAGNISDLSSNLEQFLISDRVCERTDDDKTLVLIGKIYGETTQQSTNTETGYDHLSDNA